MASQSPANAPTTQAAATQLQPYLKAWKATSELLRQGHTWSGYEANVCLLNSAKGRFVDASAVTGFNFEDDARGIAVVDWDGDGDLDLWSTCRTSPRLRFLQNQLAHQSQHFLSLKLRGVKCNRDAVGARVEVHRGGEGNDVLIRTLRAGEGYLSQSSKTVHFGLGDDAGIDQVVVRWPGEEAEVFASIVANKTYVLTQGEGAARKAAGRSPLQLPIASAANRVQDNVSIRIPAARRLPLPSLEAKSLDGQPLPLSTSTASAPRLIMLWASWCEPCMEEFAQFAVREDELRAAGVEIVPINVEVAQPNPSIAPVDAIELLKRLGIDNPGGFATPDLLDRLDIAQRVLTNKPFPPPVPSSFLLDADGRLVCVYKGPCDVDQLVRDVKQLRAVPNDPRDFAVPFAGRWYTQPFPPDLLAFAGRLIEIDRPDVALEYLQKVDRSSHTAERQYFELFAGQVAGTYVQLAKTLATESKLDDALLALSAAMKHQPDHWDANFGLAALYAQQGRHRDAIRHYRVLLRLQPDHSLAALNLSRILATTNENSLRNPDEAIRLAKRVCDATKYNNPTALDALATSYAAAGRFDDAVNTTNRAIAILTNAGQQQAAATLNQRLTRYQQQQALKRD